MGIPGLKLFLEIQKINEQIYMHVEMLYTIYFSVGTYSNSLSSYPVYSAHIKS